MMTEYKESTTDNVSTASANKLLTHTFLIVLILLLDFDDTPCA